MSILMDTGANLWFLGLTITSGLIYIQINNVQSEPYMDEIFHVPQTQEFCNGNFNKWDNKITTLPGLYMLPTLLSSTPFFNCNVQLLRALNVVYTLCIFWVFYLILSQEKPELTKMKRAFMACTLTIFPVNYFFSFLYYTDQLSTLLVLLMFCLSRNNVLLSALAGALAVFTRQTNVIWILWTTIILSWDILKDTLPHFIRAVINHFNPSTTRSVPAPPRRGGGGGDGQRRPQQTRALLNHNIFESCILFCSECVIKLAPKVMPFAIVMLSFVIFVICNKGVVVGDRSAHEVTINIPQMFYFSFFVGFMLSPLISLYSTNRIFNQIMKHSKFFIFLMFFGLLIVHYNTVAHQYLLADNRHYTFYIWKRLYEWFPNTKYYLVPCYIVIWFWIWSSMKLDPVLFLGFVTCVACNIIPQKLLEYRYFILPFYIVRLNMNYTDWKHLLPEFCMYFMINFFTIYIFIMVPFGYPSSPSRFMW